MTVSGLLDETATRCRYRAYGVELACDFPLPAGLPALPAGPPQRTVAATMRGRAEIESLWSGDGERLHRATLAGGRPLLVERGVGGDHLVRCAEHRFHLAADLTALTCTPPVGEDLGWQQALLDWAVYCVASLAGAHCLHAAAVRTGVGVLALTAPSGAGKSTLAAELATRGGAFFSDDVLALAADGELVRAHPGAPFARLDRQLPELADRLGETRGELGGELWVAVRDPAADPAPVSAVVVLDRAEGGPTLPRLEPAGLLELRALAIGLGSGSERERFELLAALAAQAALLRLRAAPAVPAAALAEAVLAELGAG